MQKKIYLEDSLEHLKKYISIELGNEFDSIEKQIGEDKRLILLNSFLLLMEKINHSIDHVKVEHLDGK